MRTNKPQTPTITRREIAVLLGCDINSLHQKCNKPGFNLPKPIDKFINIKLYDRETIMIWFEHKQLEYKLGIQDHANDPCQINFRNIMSGRFDTVLVQNNHRMKRMVSKHGHPITRIEHLAGDGHN